MTDLSRRKLIKNAGATLAAIPVVSIVGTRVLHADDMPMVDPADAQASALKYTEMSEVEGSNCANCILYTGEAGPAAGPCGIFPGKHVAAEGWCNAWQKKPG